MNLPDGMKLAIQARLESARLPRKVLEPIGGQPMILQMLDRLTPVFAPEDMLIAVAYTEENAALAGLLVRHGYEARMPEVPPDDVLARYVAVAEAAGLDAVVRLTGDCPLIDPQVVQQAIARYQQGDVDYVALGPAWPDGLDCEVLTTAALRTAHAEARLASDREHVSAFVWKDRARFRQALLRCPFDLSAHGWSVDTVRDLELVRAIYHGLWGRRARPFGWRQVLAWLVRHPDWERRATDHPRNQGYVQQVEAEQGREARPWEALRYGREANA